MALRLIAILIFVVATNSGFMQRVGVVLEQGRWTSLVGFLGLWGLCLGCLLIAALQPNVWLRSSWALVLAGATAAGFAFRHASGSDLGIMDVLSLWNARHEIGRAAEFYTSDVYWLLAILALGFAILAMPPAPVGALTRRWLARLAWTPIIPIACTAIIVFYKEGGGSQSLPVQFAPLSVGLVSGTVMANAPVPERKAVVLQPGNPLARHVLFLVDESVRGDYIDWSPDNPYTPELARLKPRIIDHGPAASGGVCSHYSNAILRFMATRDTLGRQLLANPTIWSYAKKAGFRTVYIDAQAAFNKGPGKLQNFMTPEEVRGIDQLYAIGEDVPAPELDDKLLDIVIQELRSSEPVFIYANKNGAHFPYDRGYPASEAAFRPTMSDVAQIEPENRINSFRNAVKWTVDRIFKRLFDEADLNDAAVIYTSDHGQLFGNNRLSHCTVENPDPREAFVPLMTIAKDEALRARFAAGADSNRGRATHLLIAPTLLELFGYAPDVVGANFRGSLFSKSGDAPVFTTGDIFNLFSTKVLVHPIDLQQHYLEDGPDASPSAEAPAAGATRPQPERTPRQG